VRFAQAARSNLRTPRRLRRRYAARLVAFGFLASRLDAVFAEQSAD
jgi:hypothetical protein